MNMQDLTSQFVALGRQLAEHGQDAARQIAHEIAEAGRADEALQTELGELAAAEIAEMDRHAEAIAVIRAAAAHSQAGRQMRAVEAARRLGALERQLSPRGNIVNLREAAGQ
jgi:hypothetical protein